MSVLVVGLSYRGAPLELLERLSFTGDTLPKALHQLGQHDHVREGAILSTCNRVEVYALVSGFHAGVATLRQFLADVHHAAPSEFTDRLYALYDEDAVAHLFGVAGGIDSMVIGEPQILAQVRDAFKAASREGATGPILGALFRHAIRVGRRTRAETGIARTGMTVATAGATLARRELGSLAGKTILLVGAGKMTTLSARAIAREGATILVANRTPGRADDLARRVGGTAVALRDLAAALSRADLVLASTGAPEPVVTADAVTRAMVGRDDRPLVLLDLAVPRDVDPACADIPGVVLRDLDSLRETLAPTPEQLAEVARVREIIAAEAPRFAAWQRGYALAPLLEALQTRVEGIRARELERAGGKLAALEPGEREAVEALTRAIAAKLLHDPLVAVKSAAGSPDGEALARALRALFRLED